MKIDKNRIKKSSSEVPAECQALIERLRSCSQEELLTELRNIETWTYGKCELYHWIDILDLCDSILETAATRVNQKSWQLTCDLPNVESKELLLWVLHFTTLLIEHSFSRHLYNSVEHLLTLMSSCDLHVVLGVLNLLYMFSKRSNFLTRLLPEMRSALLTCLTYLAESWGGKEHGFGLAECCRKDPNFNTQSATTLHYEFYSEETTRGSSQASCIHLKHLDKLGKTPPEIMDSLIDTFNVPKDGQMLLFTHVRLAYSFSDYKLRLKCVQARLQALSVLLYSNSFSDSNSLLYVGLLDELVELLEIKDPELDEIHSAGLRTLTSIIHLDRSPHLPKKPGSRLNMIIDVTGAGLYHGFLPQLVRTCINSLTGQEVSTYPLPLATALFSFLYHLASYEAGGEALVSCGMMECLLRVINWSGTELEHITFVTRAVRVIDLITNIDMQGFQSHSGLTSFVNRLEMEINICRSEQPFVIYIPSTDIDKQLNQMDVDVDEQPSESDIMQISIEEEPQPGCSREALADTLFNQMENTEKTNKTSCLPQRAALLKSMLNFLKKALQDPAFADSIRHVMDGSLPATLKHIVSNPEYYGPSLFLLATDVVAVYVFQEPSLLSSLQDNGLTEVVLHALLVKNVPATREVLGSLPNVFSALCLNARGLASFTRYSPFDRLFRVLLSPMYLVAMRRRRSSDPIGDTASNLGNAMDELMRHQPALKVPAISAIIQLLKTLCQLGEDPKYVCWKPQKGSVGDSLQTSLLASRGNNEGGSSDEEEDDEEEASTSSHPQREDATTVDPTAPACLEKTPIALIDYILNVMKFVDAILSNNSTDDHCREFVNQGGLAPLLTILGLPNLPVDYPILPAAQSVASVCKSILNLAHEPQVMKEGLTQLNEVLDQLKPLYKKKKTHTGSVLLEELSQSPSIDTAFTTPSATPLLHAMVAAHGYIAMFVYVCRTGQLDIRTISMTHWGSDLGLHVLDALSHLYTALVWESTILLTLCCQDTAFGISKEDIDKLCPFVRLVDVDAMDVELSTSSESITDGDTPTTSKPTKRFTPPIIEVKYLKPLLAVSSRLGRALAELFGLLVKLCVGFPARTRRGNHFTSTPISPTPSAQAVATSLAMLLARGLNCDELPYSPVPKFKLTYLICSVGFTSPMLFDEKKHPYHLMLQKFVSLKGQSAFFSAFRWALSGGEKFSLKRGLEHPDLPETTGEFLDAWLMLLEKMVNPKAILESTHMLPSKPSANCKAFDPIKYLQEIHKMAFVHVSYLWGRKPLKTYGARMTETMLTIFRHILRGERIIEERKSKDSDAILINQASTSDRRGGAGSSSRAPEINMNEMTQLMDMGFSRENCFEALMLTATLEHATDYLLSNFFPSRSQMQEELEEDEDFEPLTKQILDEFTSVALSVCMDLLEVLPDTVYRVSELLNTIMRRNGERFTYDMLTSLTDGILHKACFMLNLIDSDKTNDYIATELVNSSESQQAAAIIHLYMLLFEEIRVPCANVVHSSGMLPVLQRLLIEGVDVIALSPSAGTPKWMAPTLLLIDLLEKVSFITHRKSEMHNVTASIWRWFDLATGKWCLYMPNNNKLINESYWRGDKMLRIASGRRRYTIMFQQMIQTNEDSGKQRPIMMTLRTKSSRDMDTDGSTESASQSSDEPANVHPDIDGTGTSLNVASNTSSIAGLPAVSGMSANFDKPHTSNLESDETDTDFFHRRTGMQGVDGVEPTHVKNIVRACVKMISIPVDPDTLHAAMQVCVRFTRSFGKARVIADLGIVNILLKLTQASSFTGFTGLATILIRHILEEPSTLHLAMEKVIRAKVLPNIPPSYKELHYILRECSSAICRDPETFKTVARQILRVDVSVLNKRTEEDDHRLLMKALYSPQQTKTVYLDDITQKTVIDLLNALIVVEQDEIDAAANANAASDKKEKSKDDHPFSANNNSDGESSGSRPHTNTRSTSTSTRHGRLCSDIPNLFPDEGSSNRNDPEQDSETFSPLTLPMYMTATAPVPPPAAKPTNNTTESSQEKKKCILSKSSLLKIIGDAVRSFPTIARLITDHRYSTNQSEYIKEECSAIAFVLDHLMASRENHLSDLERPNMARMLIAALASCNHSQEAQSTLVSEVKAALARTLAWPESAKKHSHIQELVGIVTIMIEHCPPVPISTAPLSPSLKLNQFSVNNMVRCMVRKGIITDLAHIPHHLDLSSPKMPVTMNAVLKPLEALSRIMSQPTGPLPGKFKPKQQTPAAPSDEIASMQTETSTSDAIHVEGDDAAEDADNTDQDVSGAVEISSEIVNTEEVALAAVRDLMARDLSPDTARRMDYASLTSRFQQTMDNNQASPGSSSDDSDSSSNEERNNLEDNTTDLDLQEEDDDDDTHHGDENGDETGGGFDEEGLELYASDAGLLRIPLLDHDSEDLLMIEYSEPDTGSGLGPWSSNSTFPLPFSLFEDPSNLSIDNSALNRIPSHHPLLMTRQNIESSNIGSRAQRLNRPRRYQYLQMNRSSGAPVFLQSNSANPDVLSSPFGGNTRVIVMDNGLGILTNAEEEQINFVDQSGYLLGPSLAATLNNVPTSMHWWAEESRLLDGDSQADAAVVMGFELVPYFTKSRNDEVNELKEKRKKQEEEEFRKNYPNNSNGTDSEKKKFFTSGILGILDPPQSRPPTRPSPSRRMAMLAAAQEVAQATESLAGSIVESVLHPRNAPIQPPTRFLFASGPSSPQSDPPDVGGENVSNDILMHISEQIEAHNIPAALELIPVQTGPTPPELTDPLGLIPGSVPYPPPNEDPDDGFFRVNPPNLMNYDEEHPEPSPPTENMFLPCSEPQVSNLFSSLDLESWSASGSRNQEQSSTNRCPTLIEAAQSPNAQSNIVTIHPSDEDIFADEDPLFNQDEVEESEPANTNQNSETLNTSDNLSEVDIIESSQPEATSSLFPRETREIRYIRSSLSDAVRSLTDDRRRRRIRVISTSNSRSSQDADVSEDLTPENNAAASVSDSSNTLDEVPEGVDPSFLAALPEEMRAEVLSEHIRLQRLRQRVESQTSSDRGSQGNNDANAAPPMEVNPDFLAALPLSIQEEVLAQQRLEQQRQAAASSNPNDPVDPAAFFQELPHSLRQSILTDMEESQISVLPPELAAEAQNLRREWELRNRALMQERFLNHVTNSTSALSSILRTTGTRGIRRTNARYAIQNMSPSNRPHWMANWATRFPVLPHLGHSGQGNDGSRSTNINANAMRSRGRMVLDYESICCLLVLLFVDDARLNTVRLHRVFRYICCHAPTRDWVIRALLSIMEKSNEFQSTSGSSDISPPSKRMTTRSQSNSDHSPTPFAVISHSTKTSSRPLSSWLNISMEAALGCRATVFHVHKPPGRRSERTISINSQAAPFVYRHAIDILISLAKNFPICFIPIKGQNSLAQQGPSTSRTTPRSRTDGSSNFWDLLIRLDSINTSKKGKTTSRMMTQQPSTSQETDCFENSPFGQLLRMLGSPVVQRSPVLTDKLLRLLGIISVGLYGSKYRPCETVSPVTLSHLSLATRILTSNTCSEEGLEDATGLLLNITVNIPSTRDTVLAFLLQGALNMATLVCQHIDDLLTELIVLNSLHDDVDDQPVENRAGGSKGIIKNRFTKDTVVVTVPKKIKAGMDLQLSSMTPLISKTSSQAYLLRILKVIVQLKHSIRKYEKKRKPAERENQEGDTSNLNTSGETSHISHNTTDRSSQESSSATDQSSPEINRDSSGVSGGESGIDDEISQTTQDKSDESLPPLSESLNLDELWDTLSACLTELAHTQDSHAVLVLQPAVEAFFLVHASGTEKPNTAENQNNVNLTLTRTISNVRASTSQVPEEIGAPAPPPVSPLPNDPAAESNLFSGSFSNWTLIESQQPVPPHQQKFLKFAETHRTVLNQILRQCTTPLLEGPFAVLVNHTRVLDFDVKRRYFRGELERADEGHRREELAVHVRRTQVFEDSFRELHRRTPDEWKNRFYIVFEGEEGQDAGGLLREWYMIISREIFNPMYALFTTSPGDRVTYMINSSSHCNPNHLCYFKFVGRVIAKAIYDNKLLECYFTRSFYKHILGIQVKYTDMESEDYSFYQGLVYLMENHVESLGYEVTFSTEVQEFGVTEIRDLIPNGRNMVVTEENKMEYIRLVCQMKMTGAIRKQLNAFLEGFYDIIPMRLISIFNEQELELLISGLPNVDIEDLKANTEYYKYQPNSLQIQWFWRALREFDQAERAKFLQFVTGTSKVPLQGFTALEGMNGIQKFQIHRDERSTDRLPSAHTCFNQLDLPVYETYTKLRTYLLKAIHECSEGFGFA